MLANNFFDEPFRQLHSMQRRLSRDLDRAFGRYRRPFDFYEPRSFFDDEFDTFIEPAFSSLRSIAETPRLLSIAEPDENTRVYAKYEINDNGHVWKKTVEKEPGQEWKTHVEEFDTEERKKALKDAENKSLKDNKEVQSLEKKQQQQGQLKNAEVPTSADSSKQEMKTK